MPNENNNQPTTYPSYGGITRAVTAVDHITAGAPVTYQQIADLTYERLRAQMSSMIQLQSFHYPPMLPVPPGPPTLPPTVTQGPNQGDQTTRTDERVIELWLADRKTNTARAYRADIESFIRYVRYIGLSRVTLEDVTMFSESLATRKPASKARVLGTVKSLFSFAVRLGHLKYNVAAAVRVPRVNDYRNQRMLSKTEVGHIIVSIRHEDIRRLVSLMYYAGLRVEEAITLRRADCQLKAGGIYQISVVGKGDSRRTIVLSSYASQIVAAELVYGSDTSPFLWGCEYAQSTIWRHIRQACIRANITKPVSAHWFRHAHASHALEAGVPLNTLRETLGHQSLNTTSIYTHANPTVSSSQYVAELGDIGYDLPEEDVTDANEMAESDWDEDVEENQV